jgi:hypothetical protein
MWFMLLLPLLLVLKWLLWLLLVVSLLLQSNAFMPELGSRLGPNDGNVCHRVSVLRAYLPQCYVNGRGHERLAVA